MVCNSGVFPGSGDNVLAWFGRVLRSLVREIAVFIGLEECLSWFGRVFLSVVRDGAFCLDSEE